MKNAAAAAAAAATAAAFCFINKMNATFLISTSKIAAAFKNARCSTRENKDKRLQTVHDKRSLQAAESCSTRENKEAADCVHDKRSLQAPESCSTREHKEAADCVHGKRNLQPQEHNRHLPSITTRSNSTGPPRLQNRQHSFTPSSNSGSPRESGQQLATEQGHGSLAGLADISVASLLLRLLLGSLLAGLPRTSTAC